MQRATLLLLVTCLSLAWAVTEVVEPEDEQLVDTDETDGMPDTDDIVEGAGGGRRVVRKCFRGVAVKRKPDSVFLQGYKVPGGQDGGTQADLPPGAPELAGIHHHMLRRGHRLFYSPLGKGEKLLLKCCGPNNFKRSRNSCIRETERSSDKDFGFCKFFIMIPCCDPCTTKENEGLSELMDDVDGLVLSYAKRCAPRLVHHEKELAPMQIYQVIVPAGSQAVLGPVENYNYFHNIVIIGRKYNWIWKLKKIIPTFFQYEEELELGDKENELDLSDNKSRCWLPTYLRNSQMNQTVRILKCLIWWIIKKLLIKLIFWCKPYVGPWQPGAGKCYCPVYDYYPYSGELANL